MQKVIVLETKELKEKQKIRDYQRKQSAPVRNSIAEQVEQVHIKKEPGISDLPGVGPATAARLEEV